MVDVHLPPVTLTNYKECLALHLSPDVELIGIGYRRDIAVAAHLYQSLGFLPLEPTWAAPDSSDVYLKWPD